VAPQTNFVVIAPGQTLGDRTLTFESLNAGTSTPDENAPCGAVHDHQRPPSQPSLPNPNCRASACSPWPQRRCCRAAASSGRVRDDPAPALCISRT